MTVDMPTEENDRHGYSQPTLAQYDALKAELAEYKGSHELMAAQFRVMQREKEHGWQEAERWQARAEKALNEAADAVAAERATVRNAELIAWPGSATVEDWLRSRAADAAFGEG